MDKDLTRYLVTIAIPFYNAEKFLSFAINSVINQTYHNWELLLLDDGSSDGSLNIAINYAKIDNRIRVISDGNNKGFIERLNQSIRMMKGLYYARMDADDIMYKKRIEMQVLYLISHPECDVVGSSAMLIDVNNKIVGSDNMVSIDDRFIHPSVTGKAEWFKMNAYRSDAIRAEDAELWLRTHPYSSFYNIEEPLLFYRELGIPALNKYLLTQKSLYFMYIRYAEYGMTYYWALSNIIKSIIKSCMYIIFSSVGLQSVLLKMRRRKSIPAKLLLSQFDLNQSII